MSTDTQTAPESGGRITTFLRKDTTGGLLLLIAMVLAIVVANSPWSEAYFGLRDAEVGPGEVAGLQHTVGHWTSDLSLIHI